MVTSFKCMIYTLSYILNLIITIINVVINTFKDSERTVHSKPLIIFPSVQWNTLDSSGDFMEVRSPNILPQSPNVLTRSPKILSRSSQILTRAPVAEGTYTIWSSSTRTKRSSLSLLSLELIYMLSEDC